MSAHKKNPRMTVHEKRRYNATRSNNRKAKLTIPAMLTKRCESCLGWFQRAPKDHTPHQCYEESVA